MGADSSVYLDYYTDDDDNGEEEDEDESRGPVQYEVDDGYREATSDEKRQEPPPPPVPDVIVEVDIKKESIQRTTTATTVGRPTMSREEALISVKEEFAMSRKNLLKGISEIARELQEAETDEEKAKLADVIKSEMIELKSLSRREAEMVAALKKKKKSNKSKRTVIKKNPSGRSVVSLSETIIEEEEQQQEEEPALEVPHAK